MKRELHHKISIFILYFLLFAGGLWHILGFFGVLMRHLASPLLILLSIIIWLVIFYEYGRQGFSKSKYLFIIWSLAVILLAILFESVGVGTGLIFGHYQYGQVLQPQLFNVPLAIGFAWLGILLSSLGLFNKIFGNAGPFFTAVGVALFMTLFDVFMEPAAINVGYWSWQDGHVPLLNYTSWFLLGFVFAIAGSRTGLFKIKLPAFVYHAYIAQLLYFGLIDVKYLI